MINDMIKEAIDFSFKQEIMRGFQCMVDALVTKDGGDQDIIEKFNKCISLCKKAHNLAIKSIE